MFSFKVYRLEENPVVGNVSKFGPSAKRGLHSSDMVYRIQYPEVFVDIFSIQIFIANIILSIKVLIMYLINNLTGQVWIQVHPPNPSTKLRMISVGDADHVWALDTSDRLYMRQETSSPAFPEVLKTIIHTTTKF